MSASKYAVETVADYGDLCGECPLWHGETQTLYWTDIAGKRLCRCTWPERHHQIIHEQLEISGIALNTASRFVIVNSGACGPGIWMARRNSS